jgi:hypothetical protein
MLVSFSFKEAAMKSLAGLPAAICLACITAVSLP